MNEPKSSPKKPDRNDEKKRQEQSRRQLHFAITYLIASLIVLWLFQVFVLTPYPGHRNSLQRVQDKTGCWSNRKGNHRRKGHRG